MRRPPHGASARPGPCRPASGYGHGLSRPGPTADLVHLTVSEQFPLPDLQVQAPVDRVPPTPGPLDPVG